MDTEKKKEAYKSYLEKPFPDMREKLETVAGKDPKHSFGSVKTTIPQMKTPTTASSDISDKYSFNHAEIVIVFARLTDCDYII